MITRFSIFENLNEGKPAVGDYVICREFNTTINQEIIWDDIGKINKIFDEKGLNNILVTFYPKFPDMNERWVRWFSKNDIIYWAKNSEDISIILNMKKFNV